MWPRPVLRTRGVESDGLDGEAITRAVFLDFQTRRGAAEATEPEARGEDCSLGLEEGEG